MERRELERQIVEKEWLMFQQVQGVNGRAACQDDWTTPFLLCVSVSLKAGIPMCLKAILKTLCRQKHRREISLWRNMPI